MSQTTYEVQKNYVAYILCNRRDEDISLFSAECILDEILERGEEPTEENILLQYDEENPPYVHLQFKG